MSVSLIENHTRKWSSLFYNTSVRHERHATGAKRVLHEWHECDMSATRVKNFDFANDASENTLSYPYIRYMTNEKLQGAEEFHFRTTF